MKQGFTLIELLIVMVIITVLVTIALPKYQRSLERGRALEGLRNVQYAAEYANAKHMECEISGDMIKSRFFDPPNLSSGSTITISRKAASGWNYTLTAISNDRGEITSIKCSSSDSTCENLDMPPTENLVTRK